MVSVMVKVPSSAMSPVTTYESAISCAWAVAVNPSIPDRSSTTSATAPGIDREDLRIVCRVLMGTPFHGRIPATVDT